MNASYQIKQGFTEAVRESVSVLTGFYYEMNQATSALIEFEAELLNANSVWNESRDVLFDTANIITQFGQEFGISMQNGATGLYQLASAGLSAEESLTILPETLKLSMAVQGDHNTIAKLTTQTLFGFEMEASRAAEVTDKFAHAIQKSLIEYEDLSSAVKFALPFFTSTGQSIDQLLGSLQILTNRALEAGIAGRGLRQALAEFAEGAEDNTTAFRQMGIEILNSRGEMLQLTEIAAQFAEVVGKDTVNNTELLTALIQDLNVRGATAFIHLVQSSDEFTQAVQNSENAAGELDQMVQIQNESLKAQIQILKNNVEMIFFMRDASYEGTEFMNAFHEAVVGAVASLTDLLVV
jgi:TP901 family phage tail tape measure protein